MKKKILIGSIIAVVIIVLASFSSVVAKVSTEDELVEFNVEFCGLGKKHTVELTQEEADEVELLFDNIRIKLDNIETREEFKEILKWAILELEKMGLLEAVDAEELQSLVFYENLNQNIPGFNDFSFKQQKVGMFEPDENFNCVIAGGTTNTHFYDGIFPFFFYNILVFILNIFGMDVEEFLEELLNYPIFVLLFAAPVFLKALFAVFYGSLFPISTNVTMTFGIYGLGDWEEYHYPSEGWVFTTSLMNGVINWEGSLKGQLGNHLLGLGWKAFIGATGFSGIKLFGLDKCYYIGKADHVSLDTYYLYD